MSNTHRGDRPQGPRLHRDLQRCTLLAGTEAGLIRDLTVAVFEGANVHNRPAPEMIRFLMESIFVGRHPAAGKRR